MFESLNSPSEKQSETMICEFSPSRWSHSWFVCFLVKRILNTFEIISIHLNQFNTSLSLEYYSICRMHKNDKTFWQPNEIFVANNQKMIENVTPKTNNLFQLLAWETKQNKITCVMVNTLIGSWWIVCFSNTKNQWSTSTINIFIHIKSHKHKEQWQTEQNVLDGQSWQNNLRKCVCFCWIIMTIFKQMCFRANT